LVPSITNPPASAPARGLALALTQILTATTKNLFGVYPGLIY